MANAETRTVPTSRASRANRAVVLASVAAVSSIAASEPAAPEPASADGASSRRVHQHGLGIGYHAVIFGTESSDRYVLHGPALVYDYFIGRRWGVMTRVSAYYLVSGTMSGPSGEFSGELGSLYDEDSHGADWMVLAARRVPVSDELVATVGGGLHLQGFSLNGSRYSPVEDISVGVGGVAKVDYRLNHWLSVSAQLATGLDLIDLIDHQNPARWLVPVATSISLAGRH